MGTSKILAAHNEEALLVAWALRRLMSTHQIDMRPGEGYPVSLSSCLLSAQDEEISTLIKLTSRHDIG